MRKTSGSFAPRRFEMSSGNGEPHCQPNVKRHSTGSSKNSAIPTRGRSSSSPRKRAHFAEPISRRGRSARSRSFCGPGLREAEGSRQTVTALAQELRIAAFNNPEVYAAEAAQFAELKPIYVRQVLEGLAMAVNNRRKFKWGGVLELIAAALARHDEPIDPTTLFDGDDRDWSWACVKAAELLAGGLKQGAEGITFEHADSVRSIVETLIRIAPDQPEIEDFEERYHREPFFAAQTTLRGLAVELCVLLVFWLSKDPSSRWVAEPRKALSNFPKIRDFFDDQLADRTPAGAHPSRDHGPLLVLSLLFRRELA